MKFICPWRIQKLICTTSEVINELQREERGESTIGGAMEHHQRLCIYVHARI